MSESQKLLLLESQVTELRSQMDILLSWIVPKFGYEAEFPAELQLQTFHHYQFQQSEEAEKQGGAEAEVETVTIVPEPEIFIKEEQEPWNPENAQENDEFINENDDNDNYSPDPDPPNPATFCYEQGKTFDLGNSTGIRPCTVIIENVTANFPKPLPSPTPKIESRKSNRTHIHSHSTLKSSHAHVEVEPPSTSTTTEVLKQQHKCQTCHKYFTRNDYLKRHMKTVHSIIIPPTPAKQHLGIGRYYCDTCGKGFIHSHHLNRHILTIHEGFKFNCTLCGKGFSRKDNLNKHYLKEHGSGTVIRAQEEKEGQQEVEEENMQL